MRLASELCSSLDRDGLRTSPPPEPEPDPEPEPEPLALLGAVTTPVPVAEGQEGGSSLSGLWGGVKGQTSEFVSAADLLKSVCGGFVLGLNLNVLFNQSRH